MQKRRSAIGTVLVLILGLPVLAQLGQNSPNSHQAAPAPASSRIAKPKRQIPCWRQAGISPATVNERWHIEDLAKVKINTVCSDSFLSPEQKLNKIHQIQGQTDQDVANIMPADQFETLQACQAERDKAHPAGAQQRVLGPCGGVVEPQESAQPDAMPH